MVSWALQSVMAAVAGLSWFSVPVEQQQRKGITQKKGLEIIVKKDTGQTIVVVQEADMMIVAGDRVRIITSGNGTTRVSK